MRKLKAVIYKWISDRYMAGCSHYNTLEVRRASRSKEKARVMFANNNVPHARGDVFFNPYAAYKFVKQHGFPVVIKPNVSGYSRGSYFPINSYGDLFSAIAKAKLWWPTTVIEQYLLGKNYRVVATNEKLGSVIQRYPPFVIGNGKDTISTLIDQENAVREEMDLFPTMYPIKKDGLVLNHLKKHGRTLEDIPEQGQHVELFYRVALAPGGIVEIVDQDTITPANKKLFIDVVNMFGANVLGIDVIFEKGIDIDHDQQKCIFIEVNSRPYMKMHDAPRYGEKEDLTKLYAGLDALEIDNADIF